MNIKVIKIEEDYEQALSRLEEIFHTASSTNEGDELEVHFATL